jgi:hypothetical protein
MSDAGLVRSSHLVVTGTVGRVESAALPGGRIVTRARIAVAEVLKGSTRRATLVVTTPGGTVGDRSLEVLGAPTFVPGDAVLVFLQRTRGGELRTNALALGVYRLADDGRGGRRAVREAPLHDERPLAAFARTIRALAASEPPADAPDVDDSLPEGAVTERYTFLGPPPARWFEADAGKTVRYGIGNADAHLGASISNALLDAAFAAWTDVPTASIALERGPSTAVAPSVAGGHCDGKSTVQFDDPFSEIPALVDCSGVLAVSGRCVADAETTTVGGVVFRRIGEADLTVNEGVSECIGQEGLSEVLTHETGHTIGLGHSSENPSEPNAALRDATMYFLVHLDGRGAGLRGDDIAGVSAIYPPPQDADGDGVPDAADQCPHTAAGRAVDATGCACDDAGHVPCGASEPCTTHGCDAQTAACISSPVDCTGGDACLVGTCDPVGGCSARPAAGFAAVACVYGRPFPPAACAADRVPAGVRTRFTRAGGLVARAGSKGAGARAHLLARADRSLRGILPLVDRAARRRRRPLGAACADAVRAVVADAAARLVAAE